VKDHSLRSTSVLSYTYGIYQCACGAKGHTSLATHLGGRDEVLTRLKKNHEMHSVRARIREEKEVK